MQARTASGALLVVVEDRVTMPVDVTNTRTLSSMCSFAVDKSTPAAQAAGSPSASRNSRARSRGAAGAGVSTRSVNTMGWFGALSGLPRKSSRPLGPSRRGTPEGGVSLGLDDARRAALGAAGGSTPRARGSSSVAARPPHATRNASTVHAPRFVTRAAPSRWTR